MSERREGDRIVVTGTSAGSHFPRTQAATQYRLELDGTSRDGAFDVDGAVYGRDLRLRGAGVVRGPILGRGDVALENHTSGTQRLLAGLHASGSIVAKSRAQPLAAMLGEGLRGGSYIIRGDVVGEHVSLENAIVFGNVRGRRVRLTSCLVIGQVIAAEAAILSASSFLAYESPSIQLEGPCAALHALGSSDSAPTFAPFVDGAGETWPSQVAFYPALAALGHHTLLHRDAVASASTTLLPADWVRVDAVKQRRRVQGERIVMEQVPTVRYVLSIAGRALNFAAISAHIERLTWMLKTILEIDHYHPRVRERVQREWAERCRGDERLLLDLVLGSDMPAIPSAEDVQWLVKRPGGTPTPAAPFATLVRGITEGKVPLDCLASPVGSDHWRAIPEVAELANAVAIARARS